jgi:hypothetical protein
MLLAALFLLLLPQSGVERITIAPGNADTTQLSKAITPRVTFRGNVASATRAPWVDSNGWRYLRQPDGHFYCDAPGAVAATLAAAEAFAYGVHVAIHTDDAGLGPLNKMLAFLHDAKGDDFSPLVNIGFVDDGSAESGEFMNLLVRRNLMFKVVKQPDPKLDLNVTGVRLAGPSTQWQLSGSSLDAENHVGQPPQIEVKEVTLGDASSALSVAPNTVNIYRFQVAGQ